MPRPLAERAASRQRHLRDPLSQRVERTRGTPRFIRGYGYQGGAERGFNFGAEGFGADYKKAVLAGAYGIDLGAFGESLARSDNYCDIDPELRDAWGIPALRIQMTHGDNEKAMMEDAAVFRRRDAGSRRREEYQGQLGPGEPGMAIHETGTARMGADPKKSVLDPYNQTHDVKNLFVMDGACYPSSACQNPTLTFMALMRAGVRPFDRAIQRRMKCSDGGVGLRAS